ncbi:MAG: hypothetical protein AB8H47_31415 [Bacteroidia bacterium]
MYDTNGRLLQIQSSRTTYFKIERGNLSQGIYVFKISGKWEYVGKLMVE